MKITSIDIQAINSPDAITLSFRDPKSINPYNIKSILGLDAESIVPQYYGSPGGSTYYSLSLDKRVITMQVGLNPTFADGKSYSQLRDEFYKKIYSSRYGKLQLIFKEGSSEVATISGFISKFEAPLFDQLPELKLTIECDEPMLKALEPVTIYSPTLDPSNTVLSDNKSTAPHGFSFEMQISSAGSLPSLTIIDPKDTWFFSIAPTGGFINQDILHFSSDYSKELYIERYGIGIIYLADAVVTGSVWPLIFPGDNTFNFSHSEDLLWLSVSYLPTYWGV